MEPYNKNQGTPTPEKKEHPAAGEWRRGRTWAGLVIVAIGTIWIAREVGADIPRWVTSGPMLLVALGVFIGARSNFRNWVWMIPVGVGFALIADRYWFFEFSIKEFIWPAVIIIIGLVMIFRPKRKNEGEWFDWRKYAAENNNANNPPTDGTDVIDTVSVFGSVKKNILSKDFRGGEVVNFFGGTELNLTQADITRPIVLDMVQVFGGAKLIVPASWTIHSTELVSVFGGVEDKRMIQPTAIDPTKILVLRGTNVFGGLEIKSY